MFDFPGWGEGQAPPLALGLQAPMPPTPLVLICVTRK